MNWRKVMSALWRASSITLAAALVSLALGRFLDSGSGSDGGANIGAGIVVLLGWGLGVLGVLILVGAIVGDVAKAQPKRGRNHEDERPG
jgi:hypothetical protein